MKKIVLFICLFIYGTLSAQSYLPQSDGQRVQHNNYTLSYSEEHEQAEWVYYTLSPELLAGAASRGDDFRPDPKVSTQSASLDDYRASGYDRGHLCPAASMTRSNEAMSESFFLSNMSPQEPSFNRGAWKRLEEQVRGYALSDSILHVVTGPIFTDPKGSIGSNEVTIPRYYYKALYSPKKGEMIGFVMENCKLSGEIESYACTIDHIEELTEIDLFAEIDDSLQQQEANYDIRKWSIGEAVTKTVTPTTAKASVATDAQCQGVTSSGKRCKRKAQSGSKYCWQHQ